MIRYDKRTGEPLHLPPEIADNPNYKEWVEQHEYMALRRHFTGEQPSHDDYLELMKILKGGWRKTDEED